MLVVELNPQFTPVYEPCMSSDSSLPQSPQHSHARSHSHAHPHLNGHDGHDGHGHDHSHDVGSGHPSEQVTDLKSPVLIGVFQRLFWTGVALAGLWSVVYWAL
jgi:ABC-type nickel/cobalt efflux system permease component RcnA